MSKIYDLSQGNMGELARQQHRDQYATPLNGASVGSGGTRYYGTGRLTVENDGLFVTGRAEIIGQLIATGQVTFAGEVIISGPVDVSGDMDVYGVMQVLNDLVVASGGKITAGSIVLRPDGSATFGGTEISPAGKITSGTAEINPDGSVKFGTFQVDAAGNVEINADVTVNSGGKIQVGAMVMDPTANGGSLVFNNGAQLHSNGATARLQDSAGTSAVQVGAGFTYLYAPGISFFIGAGLARVNGALSVSDMQTTSEPANVHVDDFGTFRRSTA